MNTFLVSKSGEVKSLRQVAILLATLGIMGVPTNIVHGQPASPAAPQKLVPEGQTRVDTDKHQQEVRILERIVVEESLGEKITVDVKNASVEDVVAQIERNRKSTTPIVVRDPQEVSLTFSLKDVALRDVLKGISALAGCRYTISQNTILIAPTNQTASDEAEGKNKPLQLSVPTSSSARDQGMKLFPFRLGEVVRELGTEGGQVKNLSAHQIQMLQHLIDWQAQNVKQPLSRLEPDAKITFVAGVLKVEMASTGRIHQFFTTPR